MTRLGYSGLMGILLFSLFSNASSPAQEAQPSSRTGKRSNSRDGLISLTDGWEYHWGDLPMEENGLLLPESFAVKQTGWKPVDFPSNPPGRGERKLLWFRIRLAEFDYRNPSLFIDSIDINAEFYIDGVRFYSFGTMDAEGEGSFVGWPVQLIRLPEDAAGKELYIRLFSDYRDIGLWGKILLGEGEEILSRLYRKDFFGTIVLITAMLIGILFFTLYLFSGRRHTQSLYLCVVTVLLSIRVLGQLYLLQSFVPNALILEYSDAATTAFLPFWITLIFRSFLGETYRRFTSFLSKLYLGLFLMMLFGSLVFAIPICRMYDLIDLISLSGLLSLGYISLKGLVRADREQSLFYINFLVMALLIFYSLIMTRTMIPWISVFDYLLVFQFSLGLALILARRFFLLYRRHETQSLELARLNAELEGKVHQRTSELKEAHRQLGLAYRRLKKERNILKVSSITDGLTGLYNRSYIEEQFHRVLKESIRYGSHLSIGMFDLDHFKRVNDEYGHDTGDEVLRVVSELFRVNLRETDSAGRYGGEEFLILFPQTDYHAASLVAERIREQVEKVSLAEPSLSVTISGGIAQYVPGQDAEALLRRADRKLYAAKHGGRNRIYGIADRNSVHS